MFKHPGSSLLRRVSVIQRWLGGDHQARISDFDDRGISSLLALGHVKLHLHADLLLPRLDYDLTLVSLHHFSNGESIETRGAQ